MQIRIVNKIPKPAIARPISPPRLFATLLYPDIVMAVVMLVEDISFEGSFEGYLKDGGGLNVVQVLKNELEINRNIYKNCFPKHSHEFTMVVLVLLYLFLR
jgi:hypothetical protein